MLTREGEVGRFGSFCSPLRTGEATAVHPAAVVT
jgi:hypothetical protein